MSTLVPGVKPEPAAYTSSSTLYVPSGAPVAEDEAAVGGGAGSVVAVSLTQVWLMLPEVSTVRCLANLGERDVIY